MAPLRRLRSAWRSIARAGQLDRELDAELEAHLELLVEEGMARGLTPEQARRQARLALGSSASVREAVRDARLGAGVERWLRELVWAARSLRRSPGLSLAVVATLGVAIAANAVVFGAVHAVLLDPLPYRDPDRLLLIWSELPNAGYLRGPVSGPELEDLRQRCSLLEDVGGIWTTTAQLAGDGDPEQVRLGLVTGNFFDVLGVAPALGRGFRPAEEGTGAPVILISHGFWQRRFGGEPGIVGRSLRLGGQNATVVGVLPADAALVFPADANVPPDLEVFAPFARPLAAGDRTQYYIRTLGRVASGVALERAAEEVEGRMAEVVAAEADYVGSGRRFYGVPLLGDAVRDARPALLALQAGVLLLLVVAAVNVSNLLLGRALRRRRELAIHAALGASRGDLLRRALAEGLVLALLGAATGLVLGVQGLALLVRLGPAGVPRLGAAGLHLPVVAYTLLVALGAGLLVGVIPSRELFRIDLRRALERGGRGPALLGSRLRGALVTAQVALGALLLVGAGLLAASFAGLLRVDPGFRSAGVHTFRIALPPGRYRTVEAATAFGRALEARLRALPGVRAVGAVSHVPYDTAPNWSTPYVFDAVRDQPRGSFEADARSVSPGFFEALHVRLLEGRVFEEGDDSASGRPVVVIDERLAERAFPGRSAVGQRLNVEFISPVFVFTPTDATIVGVVAHVRYRSLAREVREQVFVPHRQSPREPMAYLVATDGEVAGLDAAFRREVAALDPQLPAFDQRPLDDYVDAQRATPRFAMLLGVLLAAAAALLAAIGTLGVVASSVGEREHELAVRRALGAGTSDVLRPVFAQCLGLAAAGIAIGLTAAFLAMPGLESLLFGVGARDAGVFAAAAAVQLGTAMLACAPPARRAATVPPLTALRLL